jgi:hypothetical protein
MEPLPPAVPLVPPDPTTIVKLSPGETVILFLYDNPPPPAAEEGEP